MMNRKILALISLLLCIVSVLSCVSCSADSDGDYSESATNGYSDIYSDVLELKPTEKSSGKKTEKRTEKKTTEKATEIKLVPGVSKTDIALTDKTYTFANMSAAQQKLFKMSTRVQPNSDGLIFDYSCSTIEFQGYMTGDVIIEISSKENHAYGNSFFTVYVDGKRSDTRFEVPKGSTKKLTVANFKGEYFHTVEIVKQTEFKWSLATVKSLNIMGYLIDAPKEKDYYVEFLGDSLTTAYGNIGKPGNEPSDSPKYQDGTKSYAYLFAESIGADSFILARSAAGINQCWSNEPILNYYKKLSKNRSNDDFNVKSARKPDLMVIHLGANDYNVARENGSISSSERQSFIDNGKKLVQYIRDSYGTDVPIIWAYDPGEEMSKGTGKEANEIKQILNSFGGESAGYYTLALAWSEAGAGGHPSANEHQKHAKLLLDLVLSKNIIK